MFDTIKQIEKQIQNNDIKLISVDVFDTLLLRSTKPELMRLRDFTKIQKQVLLSKEMISEDELFHARLKIGKKLYNHSRLSDGNFEVTYKEIFQKIANDVLKLTKSNQDKFITSSLKLELEEEKKGLYPREELRAFLKEQKNNGKEIIYCSDMYLDTVSVVSLLKEVMLEAPLGEVYVSSDYQKTKRQGTLFHYILNRKKLQANEVLHVGDNLISDVEIPRAMEINAFHYPRSMLWNVCHNMRKKHNYFWLKKVNLLP